MTEPVVPTRAAATARAVRVFAHRGASQERPENTLAAFARAFEQGVDGSELDVALSADGIPVVMHDETVDRTTNGSGAIETLTLEQLRALDAGGGQPVPTLDQVLALAVEHGAEINIEVKAADAAAAVLDVVRRHEGLRWFITSFHWPVLEEVRAADAAARLYPLMLGVADVERLRQEAIAAGHTAAQVAAHIEEVLRDSPIGLDEAVDFAVRIGAEGVSIWERDLIAADLTRIHAAGLLAWVWTVNDPARAAELIRDGADAICTDEPAEILAVRAALRS